MSKAHYDFRGSNFLSILPALLSPFPQGSRLLRYLGVYHRVGLNRIWDFSVILFPLDTIPTE